VAENQLGETRPQGLLPRILDSDIYYSFRQSPVTIVSAVVTAIFFIAAGFAPWLAPHNPFDPATLDLMDGFTPPAWEIDGTSKFLLGTDDQGRDILSTIMHGGRVSLIVGFAAVIFSVVLGVSLGLLAGYLGGWLETVVMRLADVQLAIPAILVALMIDGIARILVPAHMRDVMAIAARVIGIHPILIMLRHVLPNVLGPVLVMATIGLALAIITEATLSFLGVGVPPTTPSLGTLIRIGNNFLFSGEWWITLFPALALVILVLAVNLLGDWLRDALNPKLR
jgi:peptide/nickel transport system permease protein